MSVPGIRLRPAAAEQVLLSRPVDRFRPRSEERRVGTAGRHVTGVQTCALPISSTELSSGGVWAEHLYVGLATSDVQRDALRGGNMLGAPPPAANERSGDSVTPRRGGTGPPQPTGGSLSP